MSLINADNGKSAFFMIWRIFTCKRVLQESTKKLVDFKKLQGNITSHQSEWPSSKDLRTINAREGLKKREPSYTVGRKFGTVTMENSSEVPWKTKNRATIWPATLRLGINPEKNMIPKDTCTPVFTVALLTIASTWKQAKCPLTEGWIRKMGYRHTMKYCAVTILVTQLRLTLCDPVDFNSPGSSIHGILQERILKWLVMPPSQWNITQPLKRMKQCHSLQHGWIWRLSS